MTVDNKQKWINAGYRLFGNIGPDALNVEKLSIIMGLSRSSFYHYFGDVEIFESELLTLHVKNFEHLGFLMKDFESFEQLFSERMMREGETLSFQRQLLVNRVTQRYQECSERARDYTEAKTYQLWTKYNDINSDSEEERELFQAIRDFYYIHYDQNKQKNPGDVLVTLHSYFNKKT